MIFFPSEEGSTLQAINLLHPPTSEHCAIMEVREIIYEVLRLLYQTNQNSCSSNFQQEEMEDRIGERTRQTMHTNYKF